jgi:hypothetical protein
VLVHVLKDPAEASLVDHEGISDCRSLRPLLGYQWMVGNRDTRNGHHDDQEEVTERFLRSVDDVHQ